MARQYVQSAIIKTFFPNFEEVFGRHQKLEIIFKSVEAPRIEISSGVSKVKTKMQIKFINPYNKKYDAVSVICNFSSNLEFALLKDFTMAGTVKDVKLEVESMKAYFQTDVEVSEISTKVNALAAPLTKLINGYLSTGYGIPIPHHISQELSKTRVFTYDHFLMIESDPQIESRIVELADEAKDNLEKLISKKLSEMSQ